MRGRGFLLALVFVASPLGARNPDGLSVGRQMLAEDNPGELWVQRGERLREARAQGREPRALRPRARARQGRRRFCPAPALTPTPTRCRPSNRACSRAWSRCRASSARTDGRRHGLGWPAYRGTQASVRTMQHRLYDCNWQMRLPDLGFASDMSVALTSYLSGRGKGGVVQLPGVRR